MLTSSMSSNSQAKAVIATHLSYRQTAVMLGLLGISKAAMRFSVLWHGACDDFVLGFETRVRPCPSTDRRDGMTSVLGLIDASTSLLRLFCRLLALVSPVVESCRLVRFSRRY